MSLAMTPQVHVRWVPLPSGEDLGGMLSLLTEEERGRHHAMSDQEAARRFVTGRVAVRRLAAELADPPVDAADVTVWAICSHCGGPHGRPNVDVARPKGRRLSVSIAHCSAGVAVAASWSGLVGIDVEPVDTSVEAVSAIAALVPPTSRPAGRTWDPVQHWTRLESVLKADGRGLTVDPSSVLITAQEGAISATIGSDPEAPRYALADVRLDRRVRASVAIAPRKTSRKRVVPVVSWRSLELTTTAGQGD
ncbi:4'-phosphopantetheinyl transferase [Cnuibacter physcomitrellae]|uniref:Uncharacterized protein n=2 Tax=Cnuibacter physcomitrellae TaxID=1619308 RepID=A0A1X9LPB0_9MICO|nr:hypothetical protein B5808_18635 [Cnuibacter physcomitrellae]GGI39356.1 4'-phosphopantetheinyl transferase [Cnuibacter physcomitrellae]